MSSPNRTPPPASSNSTPGAQCPSFNQKRMNECVLERKVNIEQCREMACESIANDVPTAEFIEYINEREAEAYASSPQAICRSTQAKHQNAFGFALLAASVGAGAITYKYVPTGTLGKALAAIAAGTLVASLEIGTSFSKTASRRSHPCNDLDKHAEFRPYLF